MIEGLWTMMLTIWKKRNSFEHGNHASISIQDLKLVSEIVDELYN